jgi:hypothetical protein
MAKFTLKTSESHDIEMRQKVYGYEFVGEGASKNH